MTSTVVNGRAIGGILLLVVGSIIAFIWKSGFVFGFGILMVSIGGIIYCIFVLKKMKKWRSRS